MSDGISDGYREQERYERWIEMREAACVVLHVALSPPAQRKDLAKRHFRAGEPVSPVELKKTGGVRGFSGGVHPPIDWVRACEVLGVTECTEVPEGGSAFTPVVEMAVRAMNIRRPTKQSPEESFLELCDGGLDAWVRLLWSLEMDHNHRPWRDRLQALSPFAEEVILIFEPRDGGPAIDYVVSLAKVKGLNFEVSGLTRYGSETTLKVAVVPRTDSF